MYITTVEYTLHITTIQYTLYITHYNYTIFTSQYIHHNIYHHHRLTNTVDDYEHKLAEQYKQLTVTMNAEIEVVVVLVVAMSVCTAKRPGELGRERKRP